MADDDDDRTFYAGLYAAVAVVSTWLVGAVAGGSGAALVLAGATAAGFCTARARNSEQPLLGAVGDALVYGGATAALNYSLLDSASAWAVLFTAFAASFALLTAYGKPGGTPVVHATDDDWAAVLRTGPAV